jgi:mycothiol synthase
MSSSGGSSTSGSHLGGEGWAGFEVHVGEAVDGAGVVREGRRPAQPTDSRVETVGSYSSTPARPAQPPGRSAPEAQCHVGPLRRTRASRAAAEQSRLRRTKWFRLQSPIAKPDMAAVHEPRPIGRVWDRTLAAVSSLDQLTFRAFRGAEDYAGMAALINERVAEQSEGEFVTADTVAVNYAHLHRSDPAKDMIVVVDPDDRLVAYARVAWNDVSEGYRAYPIVFYAVNDVAGLADRILEWGVARATEIAATDEHPDRRMVTWSVDGSNDERAIRNVGGFEPSAWSAVMVRAHLRDIPVAPLPAGVETRPVEDGHLRAIWESDVEAFRDHHGYVEQDETDWEKFRDDARHGTALWQVAWAGDTVVGQVRTLVNEGEAEVRGRRRAWTEDISTRREWRGKGVASALIASSLRQLASLGFDEAALGVDLDNPTGALGVYERLGYQVVLRYTEYRRRL